jgi:hypothetical protein
VSLLTTAATAAYQYRATDALPFYALKRRKAQKQRSFRAKSTYGHCIKDEVLIDTARVSGLDVMHSFESFNDGCRRKYGNGVFKHMSEYKPPFHTTDKITNLVAAISEQIGRIKVLSHGNLNPHLRKENRIRTIHSSLAIEHNSLSLEQVTAIVDGKHILGNPNEIREVKNAYDTYEMMLSLDPYSVKDLAEGAQDDDGRFDSGEWEIPLRRCRRV